MPRSTNWHADKRRTPAFSSAMRRFSCRAFSMHWGDNPKRLETSCIVSIPPAASVSRSFRCTLRHRAAKREPAVVSRFATIVGSHRKTVFGRLNDVLDFLCTALAHCTFERHPAAQCRVRCVKKANSVVFALPEVSNNIQNTRLMFRYDCLGLTDIKLRSLWWLMYRSDLAENFRPQVPRLHGPASCTSPEPHRGACCRMFAPHAAYEPPFPPAQSEARPRRPSGLSSPLRGRASAVTSVVRGEHILRWHPRAEGSPGFVNCVSASEPTASIYS